MNKLDLTFCGETLHALGNGALYWPAQQVLVISDLHLGKSDRIARRSGQMLPPYEVIDTLTRLEDAMNATDPATVICLGDSFDDLEAGHSMAEDHRLWITRLMAGRDWIWIEGNHDPGPLEFGGRHLARLALGPLTFRHIAEPDSAPGEVSGHYHPKTRMALRGRLVSRPSFLLDETRLILPAFGTYTGGLRSDDAVLASLMSDNAQAILTGHAPCAIPLRRAAAS